MKRVLLVADSPDGALHAFARLGFQPERHEVRTASSLRDAVARLVESRFDIVICRSDACPAGIWRFVEFARELSGGTALVIVQADQVADVSIHARAACLQAAVLTLPVAVLADGRGAESEVIAGELALDGT